LLAQRWSISRQRPIGCRKTAPVPTSGLWHHLSAVPPTGPRPTALFLILGTASLTVEHCWSPVRGYFVTTDEVPRTAQASGFRTPGDSKRPSVGNHAPGRSVPCTRASLALCGPCRGSLGGRSGIGADNNLPVPWHYPHVLTGGLCLAYRMCMCSPERIRSQNCWNQSARPGTWFRGGSYSGRPPS
jgi:hypothetical protein